MYARIDISIVSFLTTDTEVGWYGAASSLAGMIVSPALNLWLVPVCFAKFGAGGAGIGAAFYRRAVTLTGALDLRGGLALARSAIACRAKKVPSGAIA